MLENLETIMITLKGQTKIYVYYTDRLFEGIQAALNLPHAYTLDLSGDGWPVELEIPVSEIVSVKVKRISVDVLYPNRE